MPSRCPHLLPPAGLGKRGVHLRGLPEMGSFLPLPSLPLPSRLCRGTASLAERSLLPWSRPLGWLAEAGRQEAARLERMACRLTRRRPSPLVPRSAQGPRLRQNEAQPRFVGRTRRADRGRAAAERERQDGF